MLEALPELLDGFWTTLQLVAAAAVVCLVVGIAVGLARVLPFRPVRIAGTFYVELFRNIPPLVVLFFMFFALPRAGVVFSSFVCGVLTLGLYNASFVAEAVRGGVQAVGRGQVEAARALGLGYGATMRQVILPQALVVILPPSMNAMINLIKGSALVKTIGVADLMFAADEISGRTFVFFPTFIAAAALYLALIWPLSFGVHAFERRRSWSV